jgi:hypothetical protein
LDDERARFLDRLDTAGLSGGESLRHHAQRLLRLAGTA